MSGRMLGWMCSWMDKCLYELMIVWMDLWSLDFGQMLEWMDGCLCESVDFG